MSKVTRGRAGRMIKRSEILTEYGSTLAQMMQAQVRPDPGNRVLHLGSPGAAQLAEQIAPRLDTGELVICVYTYDELEELRASLAGIGNVHVINDIDDLDEDEAPFDIVSCIAPFQYGRDSVIELVEQGVARLAKTGTFFLGGDKQHEFDRYVEALSSSIRDVQQLVSRGQYRIVSAQGRNRRVTGGISGRRN
ncbi:MAG TPA: class I SAM-dependent methyltransferase [Herpetosiphonaceae bacterium]